MGYLRTLLLMMLLSILLLACGEEYDRDYDLEFIDYSFNTSHGIELPTVNYDDLNIVSSFSFALTRDETYTIETAEDLDSINLTLDTEDQIHIYDLDQSTYFLIRSQGCGSSYVYLEGDFAEEMAIIRLAQITQRGAVCPAVSTETYMVFKASKPL